MNRRLSCVAIAFAAAMSSTIVHASETPIAGSWYAFTGTEEVSLHAGHSYGTVTFQMAAGSRTRSCTYLLDLTTPGADALLSTSGEFVRASTSADCSATAKVSLALDGDSLAFGLTADAFAIEASLDRQSVPAGGPAASPAPVDIAGLQFGQSGDDINSVLAAMKGAELLSFSSGFQHSGEQFYYNVASITPDEAAYAAACDVSRSSGEIIEDSYFVMSGDAPGPEGATSAFAITRYMAPLPTKRPPATALRSAIAAKYGEPTSGTRWVFDAHGLLFKSEHFEEERQTFAVTRNAAGEIVSKLPEPDRICAAGEPLKLESAVGQYLCGDRVFRYPQASLSGYGRTVNIPPDPQCGALLDIRIETEGDYVANANFVAVDFVGARQIFARLAADRIDSVGGEEYRSLSAASEIEIAL